MSSLKDEDCPERMKGPRDMESLDVMVHGMKEYAHWGSAGQCLPTGLTALILT